MHRIVKPKNKRSKRFLDAKESQIIENTKTAMFIRGSQTSDVVNNALKEIYIMKKPNAVMFTKKNNIRPFEDFTSLEFFSNKNDASLFVFGSHNKKRPHNLVMGHLYDYHLLDMFELGIESFQSMNSFKNTKLTVGSKPCLVFAGELFNSDHSYKRLKYFLISKFLPGSDGAKRPPRWARACPLLHCCDGKVVLKSYKTLLKKSGTKTPRVELEEIGPSMDLVMRRTHLATTDLYKRSLKVPKTAKPKKRKNISIDAFKTTHGRVHMEKQDLGNLQTRKMKALKRVREEKKQKEAQPRNKELRSQCIRVRNKILIKPA
ncbi:putative ribosome production factor 2-like [Apostichopus japonicus]|uniref:Ribosome production factor 2 homolog n=1 Tax=Stichopus japonicus TaxID=307972 RepID=A0A2G8L365_STIJA|nr:putative ribosome production factor 2-like [Apostichopus japonicus]